MQLTNQLQYCIKKIFLFKYCTLLSELQWEKRLRTHTLHTHFRDQGTMLKRSAANETPSLNQGSHSQLC